MLSVAFLALLTCDVHAFCRKRDDGSKCHAQIVRESLNFLRPGILQSIATHVNDPDERDKPKFFIDQWKRMYYATADHFDNCNFDGGTERINARYLRKGQQVHGIVEALSPLRRRLKAGGVTRSGFVDEDYPRLFEATEQWAWVLHAAQDLYSHSNWVELGFTDPASDLLDRGWESWAVVPSDWRLVRDDVVAAQKPMPPKWKMEFLSLSDPSWIPERAADADTADPPGEPSTLANQLKLGDRIPFVTDAGGNRFRLLISGHGPVPNPWNTCPLAKMVDHDALNKDNKTRRWNPDAVTMAIGQTQHEWCRLLNLTRRENTPAGAAVLMGLMVNPGQSPHPVGTLCAPTPAGGIEVVARVTQILVKDDKEDDGPGQLNFVFSGFTTDLRRSARTQTAGIAVNSGARVPYDSLPEPLRFCLNPSEQLVLTVQGWKDDGNLSRGELDEADHLLSGATAWTTSAEQLANRPEPFVQSRASDNEYQNDLEVTMEVSAKRSDVCQGKKDYRMQEPEYAN